MATEEVDLISPPPTKFNNPRSACQRQVALSKSLTTPASNTACKLEQNPSTKLPFWECLDSRGTAGRMLAVQWDGSQWRFTRCRLSIAFSLKRCSDG